MEAIEVSKKSAKIDTKVKLSLLWLFAILNYLYCDIVELMDANLLKDDILFLVESEKSGSPVA
jgi:hypothetical protein